MVSPTLTPLRRYDWSSFDTEFEKIYDLSYPERRLERVKLLKRFFYASTPQVCTERIVAYTKAYVENEGLPPALRRAYALSKYLREMTIYILPGQLFVGNQAGIPNGAPLYPEYSVDWIENEIDNFSRGVRIGTWFVKRIEIRSSIVFKNGKAKQRKIGSYFRVWVKKAPVLCLKDIYFREYERE